MTTSEVNGSAAKLLAVVVLVAAIAGCSCGRIETYTAYPNGQRVAYGDYDEHGWRVGPWLYFAADGRVVENEVDSSVHVHRTGFYVQNEWTRPLSDAELATAVKNYMQAGQR